MMKQLVLVVADGLGGMPSGEQASQIVVECIIDSLNDGIQTRDAILNGIDDANNIILELKMGAGTTVSIAEINGNTLRTYHAGDSLILLATNNSKVKYQSISHSPIGYALECGAINKEKAMRHPERNLISNYVGCNDMYINIGPIVELTPTNTLLLSSDALSDNLYEDEICEIVHKGTLLECVNDLIEDCRWYMVEPLPDRLCHPDDLTIICFRLK
ncbi:MAG: protein phosphatase 2C domain-containing protein [Proteobacteria bacterium]|nr:protein phosphatase 2C domain-containing protein [Pseudomonadota bacterium]